MLVLVHILIARVIFHEWAIPGLSSVYFCLFKQTLQFLQQIKVENVHPVYGAGIWTHNLQITILLPYPLDQGSHLSQSDLYIDNENNGTHLDGVKRVVPFLGIAESKSICWVATWYDHILVSMEVRKDH